MERKTLQVERVKTGPQPAKALNEIYFRQRSSTGLDILVAGTCKEEQRRHGTIKRVTDRPVQTIDPKVRIGHVHLKVANLDRALGFYCGVLGLDLTQRFGREAAFISAGGYHHHP
jgi:catechol-2,3-dioxygenase